MEDLIAQLNPQQREAVNTIEGPLLVLAGAGSGKTKVVTLRIVRLLEMGIPPSAILGLTFTNKAAGEMRERVHTLTRHHVLISTFHSLGSRILREVIHILGYGRDFTIYDDEDINKVLKQCLDELGAEEGKGGLQSLKAAISSAKNSLQTPEKIETAFRIGDDSLFPEVYKNYQAKLKAYNALDFDDLLFLPVLIFQEHPEILQVYQNRWSFLLIDEYQDTNHTQYTLLKYLTANSNNICAVGDPDQSIYSWRGANIQNILHFEEDFPGAKVIRLEQNYRSRTNILEGANALISHNRCRYEKKLWSALGAGEKIKHYIGDTEKDEAAFVAEKIRHYHEKLRIPLTQIAVFYRTHAQSRVFEDIFFYKRIPYVIIGGVSFYQRREIKDILAFLRMVHSGSDYVSFARTINLPKRGIGETTLEKIRQGAAQTGCSILAYSEMLVDGKPPPHAIRLTARQKEGLKNHVGIIKELRRIAENCSLKEVVQSAIDLSDYTAYLREDQESFDDRKENLNSLLTKAVEWELSVEQPSLSAFLEELSLKSSLDEAESHKDRINLMTLHNGKGLEFTLVFLVGLEEDLLPHASAKESCSGLEEERRLCYVGLTRAKEYLYISHVRLRYIWGMPREQRPSAFISEIPSPLIERLRKPMGYAREPVKTVAAEEEPFLDDADQTLPDHYLEEEPFTQGDAVFHKEFGVGIVKELCHGSYGLTYKILFSKDSRMRTLVAKFAALKRI